MTDPAKPIGLRRSDGLSRAIERFEHSKQVVEAEGAPPEETALFEIGDAFYRCRFDLPPRSLSSYGAQVAAAALDFPVLQSVSASFDLLDLQLKLYDGAVQSWETLLQHYPQTKLRPLTLYRLGWAYRNVVSTNFPRKKPNEAFDLLIKDYPASPLAELAKKAKIIPWKSHDTATNLSIVPGLGQMYTGEYLNGSIRLGIGLGAGAMILVPVFIAADRGQEDLQWNRDWPLLLTGLGGLILISVDYSLAYTDALRAVTEYNEKRQAQFERNHPEAP